MNFKMNLSPKEKLQLNSIFSSILAVTVVLSIKANFGVVIIF